MILPFSTQLNGKPTAFCDKIWQGFINLNSEKIHEFFDYKSEFKKRFSGTKHFQDWDRHDSPLDNMKFHPKLHTFRIDKNDRWKPGVMIDFFINARQKNMFRFAPRIPVVSTQKVEIKWRYKNTEDLKISNKIPILFIDGKFYFSENELKEIAQNDGFDTVEDFFAYFNTDFSGKIIHWTDLKY